LRHRCEMMVSSVDFPECFDKNIGEILENITKINERANLQTSIDYHNAKEELERRAKKGHCIVCGSGLPKGKRKYCKRECFLNWFKQFNQVFLWNEVKRDVLKRDNYTCVKCGFKDKERAEHHYQTGKLVVDHKIPVALGGDEFSFDNLQTLCLDCNRVKTRFDAKNIATARRIVEIRKSGQRTLFPQKNKEGW